MKKLFAVIYGKVDQIVVEDGMASAVVAIISKGDIIGYTRVALSDVIVDPEEEL